MTCRYCGHGVGDHSQTAPAGCASQYGICLVPGCECRAYRPPEHHAARAGPEAWTNGGAGRHASAYGTRRRPTWTVTTTTRHRDLQAETDPP